VHVQPYTLRLVQMQEAKKSLSALSLAFLPFVATSAAKWLLGYGRGYLVSGGLVTDRKGTPAA
jgi:hypothetical protein